MQIVIFWLLTILCVACALAFVLPPVWRGKFSVIILSLLLPVAAYCIYYKLGAGQQLRDFYSISARQQRQNNAQMRPLYARLQREIMKNKLNIQGDSANIDLIINFAQIHSKLSDGILQSDIKHLLESVLQKVPTQVTILNLLAIHAYKSAAYAQAADYWQQILGQFPAHMRSSAAEIILKNKIAEAKMKI